MNDVNESLCVDLSITFYCLRKLYKNLEFDLSKSKYKNKRKKKDTTNVFINFHPTEST